MNIILLLLTLVIFSGCTTAKVDQTGAETVPPLLVGITPNYPPVIFEQNGQTAGIEADLARMLAAELGRPLQFVQMNWDRQIPSLLERKTDIIMSGMSITKVRALRITFAEPILKSGLVAMMRNENAEKYNSIEKIRQGLLQIGVVEGTTSDVFIRKNFPNAVRVAAFQRASDSISPLNNKSIDIFVHDAPSIMWLVAENEADLTALLTPLNEEDLAWGVRRGDGELLEKVNTILSAWKEDGTLKRVLLKWLPPQYLERFQ